MKRFIPSLILLFQISFCAFAQVNSNGFAPSLIKRSNWDTTSNSWIENKAEHNSYLNKKLKQTIITNFSATDSFAKIAYDYAINNEESKTWTTYYKLNDSTKLWEHDYRFIYGITKWKDLKIELYQTPSDTGWVNLEGTEKFYVYNGNKILEVQSNYLDASGTVPVRKEQSSYDVNGRIIARNKFEYNNNTWELKGIDSMFYKTVNSKINLSEIINYQVNGNIASKYMKLDSISWQNFSDTTKYEDLKQTKYIESYFTNNNWEKRIRYTVALLDSWGSSITTYEYFNGTNWIGTRKYTSLYDSNYNQTDLITEDFQNGNWVHNTSIKSTYTYDANGNMSLCIKAEKLGSNTSYVNKTKTEYLNYSNLNVGFQYAKKSKNISVYPNPSEGVFKLAIENPVQVELFDLDGRVRLKQQLSSGTLDLTSFEKGIYILKVIDTDGVRICKLKIN